MGHILLEARNLTRRVEESGRWLLRDVSLRISGGDRIAVSGPSGAGKTVLLRALAMLDPLDSGELLWRQKPVGPGGVPSLRRHVAYLQQRPALIEGSVEDNLRTPFSLAIHKERVFDRPRLDRLLERLERDQTFLEQRHEDLSGGEAQIVALLRAIQLDPPLMLLDEPTASLDARTSRAVENIVANWLEEEPARRAWVWVSHDRDQAGRMSHRRLQIEDGIISEESTP